MKRHDLNGVPLEMAKELIRYYFANRQDNPIWVVLPVINFDFCFGDSTFSHKYKSKLPKDVFEMEVYARSICRYRLCDKISKEMSVQMSVQLEISSQIWYNI